MTTTAAPAPDEPARIRALLLDAMANRPAAVQAHTFLRVWPSFSRPAALACDDGHAYVVKGKQIGRAAVNDQVVARLGIAMGAPVGEPMLVDVPQALITAEPQIQHLPPGIAHGTRFVENCSDRMWIAHQNVPENRLRFARLAVLYGWASSGDHQLIYPNSPPHVVISVDHGHFFPGGPDWQPPGLTGAPPADVNHEITSQCALTAAELRTALQELANVPEVAIIRAVAAPPDDWAISPDDRVALVQYLSRRRDEMANLVAGLT